MLLSRLEEVLLQTLRFQTLLFHQANTHSPDSCSYRPFIPRRNLWSRRDMLASRFADRSGEIHPVGERLLAASGHSPSELVFPSECKQAFLSLFMCSETSCVFSFSLSLVCVCVCVWDILLRENFDLLTPDYGSPCWLLIYVFPLIYVSRPLQDTFAVLCRGFLSLVVFISVKTHTFERRLVPVITHVISL